MTLEICWMQMNCLRVSYVRRKNLYQIVDYNTGEVVGYASRKADAVALLTAAGRTLIAKKMKKS